MSGDQRYGAAAFDALSAHVAILDAEGVILAVNRAWREFADGNGGADELGRNYLEVCERSRDQSAIAIAQGIRAVLQARLELFEQEYPCHAPHEPRYFVARVTAFTQDGRRHAVVAHENVTRRKLAELQAARLNDELEGRVRARTAELAEKNALLGASNEALAQYAYVASHDLKEPLRMVGIYAEALDRHFGDGLSPRGRQYMRHLLDAVGRMHALIADLLSYAELHQTQAREVVDMDRVAMAACDVLAGEIAERGARVRLTPLPRVLGEAGQLTRLLQNLIGNALKFSPQCPDIELRAHAEGALVHFEVADRGIGIEGPFRERIFGMFQRLHPRHRFPGSGMGLAICRQIVERHGGRIWADAPPGGGTVMHFTLPGALVDASETAAPG